VTEQLSFGQESCVGAFQQGHSRIVAQFLGDLTISGVDRED
jgi:hypothetical protein